MGQSILDSSGNLNPVVDSGASADPRYSANRSVSMVAPGAPRAAWVGLRWEFK
jgi:hypothetical protein